MHVSADALGVQKRALNPLELELQVLVSYQTWVLGTEPANRYIFLKQVRKTGQMESKMGTCWWYDLWWFPEVYVFICFFFVPQ